MNNRSLYIALLLSFAFAPCASAATINYVKDGDFTNPYGGAVTVFENKDMGPWHVTGSVDLVGAWWQAPSPNGGSVDLDGDYNGGKISQSLSLNPGKYVLSFSLSAHPMWDTPIKTVRVSVGNITQDYAYTNGQNTSSDMHYVIKTLPFIVEGGGIENVDLSFLSLSPKFSNVGPVIGNVSVSSVPLPPSVLMFMMGGAVLLSIHWFSGRKDRAELHRS